MRNGVSRNILTMEWIQGHIFKMQLDCGHMVKPMVAKLETDPGEEKIIEYIENHKAMCDKCKLTNK